jgi:hypothetical protein
MKKLGYRVLDATHIETTTWRCTITYEIKWAGDAYDAFELFGATYKKAK